MYPATSACVSTTGTVGAGRQSVSDGGTGGRTTSTFVTILTSGSGPQAVKSPAQHVSNRAVFSIAGLPSDGVQAIRTGPGLRLGPGQRIERLLMAFPFALHRGAEFFVDRDRLIQLRAHAAYRGLLFKDRLAPAGP